MDTLSGHEKSSSEARKRTESPSPATDAAAGVSEPGHPRLWTHGFTLLCVITVLCYSSYQLILVVLPLFVQSLGGSPIIAGLVFTSFSVTSFFLRPVIGQLLDTWNVRGIIIVGSTLIGILAAAFIVPLLWLAFVANALRGMGWGAFSTAQATGVAYIAPVSRRAEAAGYSSVATTMATAFAPALALWLLSTTGLFPVVFGLAAAAALTAAAAAIMLPRMGHGGTTFRRAVTLSRKGLTLKTFIERPVLLASMLLLCITMTQPVTFAFVPLHAKALGIQNISLYFLTTGTTGVLARILLGRVADRGNRGIWIAIGYSVMAVACGIFMMANRIEMFIAAGFLNAIGSSLGQPALAALAMDLALPGRMGMAMATYSMSYRVGDGLGAPLAGTLIVAFGYPGMYAGAMAFVLTGLLLTVLNWRKVGSSRPRHTAT